MADICYIIIEYFVENYYYYYGNIIGSLESMCIKFTGVCRMEQMRLRIYKMYRSGIAVLCQYLQNKFYILMDNSYKFQHFRNIRQGRHQRKC